CPFPHSFTSLTAGTPFSRARRLRRAGGSSSTSIALIFLLFASLIVINKEVQTHRDVQQNLYAALFSVAHFEREVQRIKLPQPRFRVHQANAFPARHPPALRQSDPVVADE